MLTYDAENHLVSVTGGVIASFVYDGDGNRVKGTIAGVTTAYIGNYAEWISTAATYPLSKYYYAGSTRIAMRSCTSGGTCLGFKLLLGDHLGSTSITTDSSGNNPITQSYYPWGEKRWSSGTIPTTFQYTGQRREKDLGPAGGEGLYYYGARWYDPAVGRFVSADTIIPDIYNSIDWDHYSYARNNPARFTDPNGHCSGDPNDPDNPDATCWQWIETITNEFTNIWIDPMNWIAEELEAVWQALVDHVFLPEIQSASKISLFRRSVDIEKGIIYGSVGGKTTGDDLNGYNVTIYDYAYLTLPGANGTTQNPSIDNFRGVVAHEFAHVGVLQNPAIEESYLNQKNVIDKYFSTLGRSYVWSSAGDPTAERIAIAAAAWEVDPRLFTDHSLWISWTDWQYGWTASYAHRDFCSVPIP